jgi:mono/diheme cytochrome c family protein
MLGACGGDDEPTPFAVYPNQIYTGWEAGGGATYKVPIKANEDATFTLDGTTGDFITLVDNGDGSAEITSKAPGVGRILVSGSTDLMIDVTVHTYTAEARQQGAADYQNGSNPPCGQCHDGNSEGSNNDNTPSAIAEHPDEAVLFNIKTGNDPDGQIIRDFHKFPSVREGVVAYLRSLPARNEPGPNL